MQPNTTDPIKRNTHGSRTTPPSKPAKEDVLIDLSGTEDLDNTGGRAFAAWGSPDETDSDVGRRSSVAKGTTKAKDKDKGKIKVRTLKACSELMLTARIGRA